MSTMSQLGEFIATIQNKQDARTAELEARLATLESKDECGCAETISALEERLATLEGKEECGCAETITALEERLATLEAKEECGCAETITALEQRLATLESKEECGCAETITALEQRLATLEAKEECGCAETITALEERLATLESKDECGCGSYDELLASYEQRISALEGNGGSTEGEGGDSGSTEGEGDNSGSTEGEGGENNSGSTEPIPASQALETYNHLIIFYINPAGPDYNNLVFISKNAHTYRMSPSGRGTTNQSSSLTASYLLSTNEGDIVKVYTPDLQEIEIIVDSTCPYCATPYDFKSVAFGNKTTKEVYCYDVDCANMTISPCADEAFIAEWGNSDALGL